MRSNAPKAHDMQPLRTRKDQFMQFSSRLDRFGAEVFSALNARRVALEEQGRTIYNLSVGTPDFAPHACGRGAHERGGRSADVEVLPA